MSHPLLRIEQREERGVSVIEAHGELDLSTAPELAARLDAARRHGVAPRVVVDLTDLEFCDSTGLRALLGAATEVRRAGGRLVVVPGAGAVLRLLSITGAEEWLDIQSDAARALAALSRR